MFRTTLSLLRIHHYLKNFFIFFPALFAFYSFQPALLGHLFVSWISFSILCSAVYIINDVIDAPYDRYHLSKKNRPIASGKIPVTYALILAAILAVSGLLGLYILQFNAFIVACFYVGINLAYTFKLKHLPILDMLLISIGFVLRVMIGGSVAKVHLSAWIIIMTFLLALFLSASKRYKELELEEHKSRPMLLQYTREFLIALMTISGAVVIFGYIMYTLQVYPQSLFFLTTIFVIYGILRYLLVILKNESAYDPTQILIRDPMLQIDIVAWLATSIYFLS